MKEIFNVGYDPEASLTAATNKQPRKKRKRSGSLLKSPASSFDWMTTMSDLTNEEYKSWPQNVLECLDASAPPSEVTFVHL